MRKATTVKPQMWQKPGFLRFSSDVRLVYSFLITGPDSNLTGIVRYPIDMVSMCTGLPKRSCETALGDLVKAGRIAWDADAGIIFVIRYLKHNPLNSPKLVAGYIKYLEAFDGHPFATYAVKLLKHGDYDRVSIEYRQSIDTLQGQGQGSSIPLPVPQKKNPPTPQTKTARQGSLDAREIAETIIVEVNAKFGTKRSAVATLIRAVEILLRAGVTRDDILLVVRHRLKHEDWFDPAKYGAESLIRRDKFPSMLQIAREAPVEFDYPEMPEV